MNERIFLVYLLAMVPVCAALARTVKHPALKAILHFDALCFVAAATLVGLVSLGIVR